MTPLNLFKRDLPLQSVSQTRGSLHIAVIAPLSSRLPESFAGDPARMARFEREAKVLALLNHPNIKQIHGVEERARMGSALSWRLSLRTQRNLNRCGLSSTGLPALTNEPDAYLRPD